MQAPSSFAFMLQGTMQQHRLKMLCEALPALSAGPSPGLGCYRGAFTLRGKARLQNAPRLSQAYRHQYGKQNRLLAPATLSKHAAWKHSPRHSQHSSLLLTSEYFNLQESPLFML